MITGKATLEEQQEVSPGGPPSSDAGASPGTGAHLVRGSAWFVASVLIGAAGGFVLTTIATRVADTEVLGEAQALVFAVLFVNYATGMGLPVAVARYGAASTRSVNVLYAWALLYTALSSLVGTVAFFLVANLLMPTGATHDALQELTKHGVVPAAIAFCLMVMGMSFTLLVEVRLVTLRQWRWVLARVLLVNGVRIPLVLVAGFGTTSLGLLFLLVGVPALSGLIGAAAIHFAVPRQDRGSLLPLPAEARPALRYASVNYVGMLAAQAPQFTVPLVVATAVAASENSAFSVAWMITSVLFLLPHTVGQVLLAESSRQPGQVGHQVRLGLAITVPAMAVAAIGAALTAPTIAPIVFGEDYQLTGDVLGAFVAAGVPWAVTSILLARARALGQNVVSVVITLTFAVATLGSVAAVVGDGGVTAASRAWFAGNVAAAVVAVVATVVARPGRKAQVVASREPARA